jgi:hypothetical protein
MERHPDALCIKVLRVNFLHCHGYYHIAAGYLPQAARGAELRKAEVVKLAVYGVLGEAKAASRQWK